MNSDIILNTLKSNMLDEAKELPRRLASQVVPNKTAATKAQKEDALPRPQRLDKIKSSTSKNTQNRGLNKEKW